MHRRRKGYMVGRGTVERRRLENRRAGGCEGVGSGEGLAGGEGRGWEERKDVTDWGERPEVFITNFQNLILLE